MGGAWPFLVDGVICLVNSVNERDLNREREREREGKGARERERERSSEHTKMHEKNASCACAWSQAQGGGRGGEHIGLACPPAAQVHEAFGQNYAAE